MADWYGTARSNYFAVKDKEKFQEFCNKWDVEMINKNNKYGFLCTQDDKGGLPSFLEQEEDEDGQKLLEPKELGMDDFVDELATHLKPGHVAVLVEIGAEKYRYLTGYALAINSKGKTESINIGDITELAKKLGKHITEPQY